MVNTISVFLTLVPLVCFVNTAVISESVFPLDIIHYNDFHARFEETSVDFPVCQSNDTRCLGGFARLFSEIKTLLKEKPDAILLNAGDTYQGTYWYTLLKWNVTQHFINMLPHDAHTIGNHEFDNGIKGLAPYLVALRDPVVVANIDRSREPSLNGLFTSHIVVDRRKKKIGIIGVTTTSLNMQFKIGGLIIMDPVEVVRAEARILTEKGVDIIVVLSHCGLAVDMEIAKAAGENVDIIVGGHSHSLLWNGPSPSKEYVHGPYPMVVESKSRPEHKVLIVQSSCHTKYLGNITVYFNPQGEVVSYDAGPVFLNRSIPEDPEIKALLQPYTDYLHSIVNEVVGFSNNDLILGPCGYGECAIGNFLMDASLDAAKQAFPSHLSYVGFITRQMIKSSLPKGNITRANLINIFPFGNHLVSVVVAGRYLLQGLENCWSFWWKEDPFESPLMPIITGMEVTLNTTSRKVVSVFVNHKTGLLPLDLDEDYQFVTYSYLFDEDNGFNMFKKYGRDVQTFGKDSEILANYVRKASPLNDILDKRLIVIK